jgi:hypothetical protein
MTGVEIYKQFAASYWPEADAKLATLAWEEHGEKIMSPLMDYASSENYIATFTHSDPKVASSVSIITPDKQLNQYRICIDLSALNPNSTRKRKQDSEELSAPPPLPLSLSLQLPPLLSPPSSPPRPSSPSLVSYSLFGNGPKRQKTQSLIEPQQHLLVFDFDQTLTLEHTFGYANAEMLDLSTRTEEQIRALKEGLSTNLRAAAAIRFTVTELLNSGKVKVAVVSFHNNPEYIKLALQVLLQNDSLVEKISIICVAPQDQSQRKAPQIDVLCQAFNIDGSVVFIDDDMKNITAVQRRGIGRDWRTVHADVAFEAEKYLNHIMSNLPDQLFTAAPNLLQVSNYISVEDDRPKPQ